MISKPSLEVIAGVFALVIGSSGVFLVASQFEQSLLVFLAVNILLMGTAAVILVTRISRQSQELQPRQRSLDELLVLLPAEVRGEIGTETKELVSSQSSANPSYTLSVNALIVQLGRHIKNQNDLLLMNFTHLLATGGGSRSTSVFPLQFTEKPARVDDQCSKESSISLDKLRSELSALEDQLATDLKNYQSPAI